MPDMYSTMLLNGFCPTGPGGGIDNSCSSKEEGGGATSDPITSSKTRGDLVRTLQADKDGRQATVRRQATQAITEAQTHASRGLPPKEAEQVKKMVSSRIKKMANDITRESETAAKETYEYVKSGASRDEFRTALKADQDIHTKVKAETVAKHSKEIQQEVEGYLKQAGLPPRSAMSGAGGVVIAIRKAFTTNKRKPKPKFKRRGRAKHKSKNPLRLDPSRTAGIRRQMILSLRERFARIKLAIADLIEREDAFGMRPKEPPSFVGNVFCATGPGGGIDPTCGRGEGGSNKQESSKSDTVPKGKEVEGEHFDRFLEDLQSGKVSGLAAEETANAITRKYLDKIVKIDKGKIIGAVAYEQTSPGAISIRHIGSLKPGAGTEIIKELQAKYSQINTIDTRSSAIGFYQKMGFTIGVSGDAVWKKPTTNARYSFLSSAAKLKAFRAWLRQLLAQELTGKSQEELWQRFIRSGYEQGAKRSFEDVRSKAIESGFPLDEQKLGRYLGNREEFLRSSFSQPVAREKVELLATRSFDDLEDITTTMSNRISRTLASGMTRGISPRETARELMDEVDISKSRAETIARTEIIRAHAQGQLMALEKLGVKELGVMVEWSTTGDDKVCELCQPLEGVVLRLEEAQDMLPRHPNCVLPGNCVQGRVIAALHAHYSGDAFEITTKSGIQFSVTAKHPILSEHGFVSADSLQNGENLVGYFPQIEVAFDFDEQHKPTKIEEVFKSLSSMPLSIGLGRFNFDGDEASMVGEVKVVASNLLLTKGLPNQRQSILQLPFTTSDNRSMGSLNLLEPCLVGHLAPLEELSFASAPKDDSMLLQSGANKSSPYAESLRKCFSGFPGQVSSTEFWLVDEDSVPSVSCFGLASELDVVLSKPSADGISFNSDFGTQLLERFPGKITLDEIIHIRRFHYSGPVYDLETTPGYFSVSDGGIGSIITGNCRCAWIPANVDEDEEGQTRTKGDIEDALEESEELAGDGWGPGDDIEKDRPRSVFNFSRILSNLA